MFEVCLRTYRIEALHKIHAYLKYTIRVAYVHVCHVNLALPELVKGSSTFSIFLHSSRKVYADCSSCFPYNVHSIGNFIFIFSNLPISAYKLTLNFLL